MRLIRPEEESLILSALRRAFQCSPLWRDRLGTLGLSDRDFISGFPFESLPLIEKSDLLRDQIEHPPFGKLLAVPAEQIRRIHKTSGTSGIPFFIALTERDIADTYVASKRAFRHAGVSPGDRVVHCLNFNMWSGGVTDYLPLEMIGATAIPFGVGNTSSLLSVIKTLKANAISATPSYMFALKDRVSEELGIDPRELGLKRGYFGGEGVLQIEGVRAEIESAFDMRAIDANYGMSEVLSIIAGEGSGASSADRDGLTYHAHGILYAELIDTNGHSLPLGTGVTGELVLSSLRREGQPLFRYRTRDLVEIRSAETADDDLLRMRFKVVGRSDEMLVIKGVNFFPQALLSVLPQFEPHVSRFYRVVRPKGKGIEALRVILETGLSAGKVRDDLTRAIQEKIAATFQVRVEIDWKNIGELPRESNKARFLIDG